MKVKQSAIAVCWLSMLAATLLAQPGTRAADRPAQPPPPDLEFRPRAWPFQFSALADTRFSDYKKSPAASFPKIR
ncbi:MAG: hypothetical protein L0099_05545, partial [Acidobacteria bacterium]|nr:hypothetical protein [Acidobacteriota bacterium]